MVCMISRIFIVIRFALNSYFYKMNALRLLLFPLALIYGFAIAFRNMLYGIGLLRSTEFDKPVINVGNLTTGGTGKSPHIEYLIRLLTRNNKNTATLSRGYGRSTSGFLKVETTHTADHVGDEPLQFKTKFPDLTVAVDGNRTRGCSNLFSEGKEVILLDDAFQHRAIKPSLNILLTEYENHYRNDMLLPSGNLREFKSGAARADLIIVTKCPDDLSPIDRRRITSELKTPAHQPVLFSRIAYSEIVAFNDKAKAQPVNISDLKEYHVVVVTGIANPTKLVDMLKGKAVDTAHIRFGDHRAFDGSDVKKIKDACKLNPGSILLTTEKDIMRLNYPSILSELEEIPLYYIPITIQFDANDQEVFDNLILDHV